MTREEALNKAINIVSYFEAHFAKSKEAREDAVNIIEALEQEPRDDEYIKVPKKALKYRTAGMVAYNVEWLKNHFDIERAVICGAQEPCEDAISRQAVLDLAKFDGRKNLGSIIHAFDVEQLPPVTPAEKVGQWIPVSERLPEEYADVICCTDAEEVFMATYLGKMDDGSECFDDDNGMMWEGEVIAWMPLPEPYKEGEE